MNAHRPVLRALTMAAALVLLGVGAAHAITLAEPFTTRYTVLDLGPAPGVPTRYGGLTFKAGDPGTLLIGGAANGAAGALYAVRVSRGADNRITGFDGDAGWYAGAANNDGGVAYGPGGVLFTSRWPLNELGQLEPGSTATDRVIALGPSGIAASPGGLNFVPAGFDAAGRFKMASYDTGKWYDVTLAPDGTGTFDVVAAAEIATSALPGGPEGFVYVPPGSPLFSGPSVLVAEYRAGNIVSYEVDANGDPIIATRRVVISGLNGAEGAAIDPVTGDFVFSTYGGGDRIVVVRGFAAPPAAPPVPAGRFDVALSCPGSAPRGAMVFVEATFTNTTATARRVERGALTMHAGELAVTGPLKIRTIEPTDVAARTVGAPPCAGCPQSVEAGVASANVQVAIPALARPASLVSLGMSFLGTVGQSSTRKMLGSAACVIEVTR